MRWLLVVMAFPALGQASERSWIVEPLERRFEAREGVEIRLSNSFGEIMVHGEDSSEIVVYAAVQRHADDPRRPELVVDSGPELFDLRVTYAESPEPTPEEWRKRRIDLNVYLPRTSPLRVRTLHERLRVRHHAAAVEAVTESGDVEILSAGRVEARSRDGKVWSRVHGQRLAAQTLATVTGDVWLDVPWSSAFRAKIETAGMIASDYSIDIVRMKDRHRKRGTVKVGRGGPEIVLRSERGNVRLLRKERRK